MWSSLSSRLWTHDGEDGISDIIESLQRSTLLNSIVDDLVGHLINYFFILLISFEYRKDYELRVSGKIKPRHCRGRV